MPSKYLTVSILSGLIVCFGLWRPCVAGEKVTAETLTDADVEAAIKAGVDYLWSIQAEDGSFPGPLTTVKDSKYPHGETAIATYALLASGVSPTDERMVKALDYLRRAKPEKVYEVSFRANAWYLANRKTGGKYRRELSADTRALLSSVQRPQQDDPGGYYAYDILRNNMLINSSGRPDHSNSQYGVLGVWAGSMDGVEVPQRYWEMVYDHWKQTQNGDGGWGYFWDGPPALNHKKKSTATMTTAGLATMFVCIDNMNFREFNECGRDPNIREVEKGLAWMARHFEASLEGPDQHKNPLIAEGGYGYHLYGVERVGLASGYRFFGKHDWYREGAALLVNMQARNSGKNTGSWQHNHGPIASTAYSLLFLVRGRQAVAFNRLEYDGDWNNRPRALASLTRFLSEQFEADMHWQIMTFAVEPRFWHDAPILVVTGSESPKFTPQQKQTLKEYVHQGGMILSLVECNGKAFDDAMKALYLELFPQYEMQAVGDDHPLMTAHLKLRGRVDMGILSNEVRPLAMHINMDLPLDWQFRREATRRQSFEIPANILVYTTGRQFRSRGGHVWPGKPSAPAKKTLKAVRLEIGSNFDPEPLALQRFSRLMQEQTGVALSEIENIKAMKLAAAKPDIAFLTGTGAVSIPADDADAIKTFVEGGGTLVIDAAGGDEEFRNAMRKSLDSIFGQASLQRLPIDSPIYTNTAYPVTEVHYRPKTGSKSPRLEAVMVNGRAGVIFSGDDLTAALVGSLATTVSGYVPDSAYALLRNTVLMVAGE